MQKRGFRFLNKKAQLITRQMLIHLGMISILIVVYFFLKGYVDSVKNDATFEMTFLARDLALLTNAIYSVPGNLEYTYPIDTQYLNKFNFEFGELSNTDDRQLVKISGYEQAKNYPYGKPQEDKEKHSIYEPQSMKFSKYEDKLSIKNE